MIEITDIYLYLLNIYKYINLTEDVLKQDIRGLHKMLMT